METSHTSSGNAESRLIHLHGRGLFPNLGRGRRVERGPAKAPETIEHEGRKMTQREVMAEKEKKMEELREKAKKAKDAKDALKKRIVDQDHASPHPTDYNYAHDNDAVIALEKEIANLEQKVQKIEKTSWRTAMDAVKDAEQSHDEIVRNISNADNQIAESLDKDQERQTYRKDLMSQADEQFGWVEENIERKNTDVQYTGILGIASIGKIASVLMGRAADMEALAKKYDALDGKIAQDDNFITRLRTAAQKCRDLIPAMNEHEKGIMKMQKQNVEKQQELAPRVQEWKQKAEIFKEWKELEAGALAAKKGGVTIVENWIRAGKELQTEFQALSSVLDGTDAAFNFDIGNNALPQLETLKTQVRDLVYAEKVRTVLEPVASLRGMSGVDAIKVLTGESRSSLEKVKEMSEGLKGVMTEMLNGVVKVASPEVQALEASLDELIRIQAEMEKVVSEEMNEKDQERLAADGKLVEQVDKLLKTPVSTLSDQADARAHVRNVETLLKTINDRLYQGSTPNALYTDLENRAFALGIRLEEMKKIVAPATSSTADAETSYTSARGAPRSDVGLEEWNTRQQAEMDRLNVLVKQRETQAAVETNPGKKRMLLEDAAYFKAEAGKKFGQSMETVIAEREAKVQELQNLSRPEIRMKNGNRSTDGIQNIIEKLKNELAPVAEKRAKLEQQLQELQTPSMWRNFVRADAFRIAEIQRQLDALPQEDVVVPAPSPSPIPGGTGAVPEDMIASM